MTREEYHLLERLYIENFRKLYCYANAILKDRAASENLVNDTFVDAVRKADCLRTHENPTGWLVEALKLNIRSYLYKQNRQPVLLPLDTVHEQFASVESLAERVELQLTTGLLSNEDRQLFELYYKQGYSHREIATLLAISVSASQKRLERIKRQLRVALEKND